MKLHIRKLNAVSPLTTSVLAAKTALQLYPKSQSYREKVWALLLNRDNTLIGAYLVSVGGMVDSTIDGRLICRAAIENGASGVILVHNHPSGNPMPGQTDIVQTEKVSKMLNVFDIKLLDHIVLGDGCFFSFEDNVTVSN